MLDDEDAEFGKIHPSQRVYEIESITWPPKLIKTFHSFSSAMAWAKTEEMIIGEIA